MGILRMIPSRIVKHKAILSLVFVAGILPGFAFTAMPDGLLDIGMGKNGSLVEEGLQAVTGTLTDTPTPTFTHTTTYTGTQTLTPTGSTTLTTSPTPSPTSTENIQPTATFTVISNPSYTPTLLETSDVTVEPFESPLPQGEYTSTPIPYPSVVFQYPVITPALLPLSAERQPNLPALQKQDRQIQWQNILRFWPCALIVMLWVVIGVWFILAQRRLR